MFNEKDNHLKIFNALPVLISCVNSKEIYRYNNLAYEIW